MLYSERPVNPFADIEVPSVPNRLAGQFYYSTDIATRLLGSVGASASIANTPTLSRILESQVAPVWAVVADMLKGMTGAGALPKISDQLPATIPSPIIPKTYTGGIVAQFTQVFGLRHVSNQTIAAFTEVLRSYEVELPSLATAATVLTLDWCYRTPSIDFASIFSGALPATDLAFNQQIDVPDILGETRQQLANLFKRLNIEDYRNAISSSSKWTDSALEHCDHSLLEGLLLDEGLALLWVVEPELRVQIFSAQSKFARLHILSDHQESIVDHCCELLEDIDQPDLAEWRDFAVEVAGALRGGYTAAAQALAVNLIDTMLIENFTYQGKGQKMSHGTRRHSTRFNIDAEKEIEQGIVYGGLWGMFLQFHSDSEDAIPHQLSRHATAHAVSKRQYRRVNSLIAFMHAVDYLCLWQEGKAEKAKAA